MNVPGFALALAILIALTAVRLIGLKFSTVDMIFDEFVELHGDRALVRLAKIVHAADIDDDIDTDPAGVGLLLIGIGGLDVESDDQRLLERASFVYDALYAWCQRATR